jgi:hypothetical protein
MISEAKKLQKEKAISKYGDQQNNMKQKIMKQQRDKMR